MSSRTREAEALFHTGTQLMDEDAEAAERAFRQALALDPAIPEVHANLGLLLERLDQPLDAEHHHQQALALRPALTQASLNLGVMLERQRRFDEAEAVYHRALAHDPSSAPGWSNLGVLLAGLKREEEAERCHRKALALDPGYDKASFNLAYLLLRQGRFDEGWERLESRSWYLPLESALPCPRWQGEPLPGRSLLIGLEAGHGDMIQFSRYASLIKRAGASRVDILCQPALKPLFSGHRDIDVVLSIDEPLAGEAWDFWAPPLSLPLLLGTRIDTIPADIPYLQADPQRMAHWRQRLEGPEDGLKVGLVWKGNPQFENDGERSLPSLSLLSPLAAIPGVRLFSLQKGAGEDEVKSPPFPLTDLAPEIADFADTAAVASNLDLIISVDTAVAHLAGALGRNCWLMLPCYKPDWRWLSHRHDSPWYPGCVKLFWQQRMGDWTPVIADIAARLQFLTGTAPRNPDGQA